MTTLEQFVLVAELIASIAVIGSLVYVAKQLIQNTEAIHAQSRQAIMTNATSEIFEVLENPSLVLSIAKEGDLTMEERIELSTYFTASFTSRDSAWLQWRNGVIDESQWETEKLVTEVFLDSSKVRQWWERFGKMAFSREYKNFIDALISDRPATDTSFQGNFNWAQ